MANGVMRMHRKVSTSDVESYAQHASKSEVETTKDEDLVYKNGVLTSASGKTDCKIMQQVSLLYNEQTDEKH